MSVTTQCSTVNLAGHESDNGFCNAARVCLCFVRIVLLPWRGCYPWLGATKNATETILFFLDFFFVFRVFCFLCSVSSRAGCTRVRGGKARERPKPKEIHSTSRSSLTTGVSIISGGVTHNYHSASSHDVFWCAKCFTCLYFPRRTFFYGCHSVHTRCCMIAPVIVDLLLCYYFTATTTSATRVL